MSRRTTTIWVIGAVVVVGAGIGVAAGAVANAPARSTAGSSQSPSAEPSTGPSSGSGSPTPPPSTTDPSNGTSPSSPSDPSDPAPTTPAVTVKKVVPSMSYYAFASGKLTLGGGVSGLVDSGGTCTVTVTNGSSTVSQAFAASPGPSSTDCGAMTLSSPKLASGPWTVTIAYSSPRATGTSIKNEVTL